MTIFNKILNYEADEVNNSVEVSVGIIGLIHVFFHALTFAGSRGSCVNMRPQGRVFKLLLRNQANTYAVTQTCVIVILAFYLIP